MLKRIGASIICLVSVVALAFAQGTADDNFIDAVSQFSAGNYTRAEKILETISLAAPENDAVWYYLAKTKAALGKAQEVGPCIEKALSIDPSNYWYRYYYARYLFAAGKAAESFQAYESMLRDFPDHDTLEYELLDRYLQAGCYEEALSVLDRIELNRGKSEETVQTRYEVLSRLGRFQEAIDLVEQFNDSYSSPSILTIAGDHYLQEFSDSLAAARYTEALSLDGSYIPALLGISEVYRRERRYDEYFGALEPFFSSADVPARSKGMYLKTILGKVDSKIVLNHLDGFDSLAVYALRVSPTDSTLITDVATYYYSTGRRDKAGMWFSAVASLYPDSRSHAITRLQYLVGEKQYLSVEEYALEAYDRFHHPDFMDFALYAAFSAEDYDSVIEYSRRLVKDFPKDNKVCLEAWSSIGDAFHSKGDSRQAFKAYDRALRIDPLYAPVLNNYAYYLSIEGKKLKKAYSMSKKTVEAEPDNATYLDTFGWILHLMGKDLEAKPFFKHAMLYGGKDSPTILEHYAIILEALGEQELSKYYYNQAKARQARLDAEK